MNLDKWLEQLRPSLWGYAGAGDSEASRASLPTPVPSGKPRCFSSTSTALKVLPHARLFVAMDAVSVYTIAPNEYPHGYHRAPSPATSLSPTLVNVHSTERPSLKFRFPSGASNVLNSVVVNAAGQSLYSISSNSKRTTLISCSDNVEIANVHWDCRSPRMVFRRKKTKCKHWLPRTGPENEYSPLTPHVYPSRI